MRNRVFLITAMLLIAALLAVAADDGREKIKFIKSPEENESVNTPAYVVGLLPSDVSEDLYLWIAVKPLNDAKSWYPQDNGAKLTTVGGAFNGNAHLGGKKGDRFEIAILLVNNEINEKFMDWLNVSRYYQYWPSITIGHHGYNHSVAKAFIEEKKLDSINVVLNE